MLRALCWTLSGVLHLALIGVALLAPVLRAEEPPVPFDRGIICVWPFQGDIRSVLIGSSEAAVRAWVRNNDPFPSSAGEPFSGCVRYEYKSGARLTILFREGRATGVWLGADSGPHACRAPLVRVADPVK